MKTILTISPAVLFACSLFVFPLESHADEGPDLVTVELVSGRHFTAAVDARTDQEKLWLRFDGNSSTLLRGIAWNSVKSVFYEGKSHTPVEFRQIADDVESKRAPRTADRAAGNAAAAAGGPSHAELAVEALAPALPVHSIQIDAYLANWDSDVEVDGLVLHIAPLDPFGFVVPARGTVTVELFGNRIRNERPIVKFGETPRPQQLQRLEFWTKQLVPEAVGPQGVVYRLPFSAAAYPQFDRDIGRLGLVNVRLAVPGDGVFEASLSDVRLRKHSDVRDQIEASSGQRYLPSETTGRRGW